MLVTIRSDRPISSTISHLNPAELALVFRQISVTQQSGLSILDALEILRRTAHPRAIARFLDDLILSIQTGGTLTDGFRHWQRVLPAALPSLMESAESTGRIAQAFATCAEICEATVRLRREVRSALAYPVFLLFFSFFALSAPILFMQGLDVYLKAVLTPIALILSVFYGLKIAARRLRSVEHARKQAFRIVRSIPYVGYAVTALESSRFAWMLSMCLRSGLEIQESLRLAALSTADPGIMESIERSRMDMMRSGNTLTGVLASVPLFPRLMIQMTEVGEASGAIPEMMDRANEILRAEGLSRIRDFLRILPVIAFLMVAIYLATVIIHFWSGHFSGLEKLLR